MTSKSRAYPSTKRTREREREGEKEREKEGEDARSNSHIRIDPPTHTHTHIHTHTHTHIHTHTYTHIHTHSHTHIDPPTHPHTRINTWTKSPNRFEVKAPVTSTHPNENVEWEGKGLAKPGLEIARAKNKQHGMDKLRKPNVKKAPVIANVNVPGLARVVLVKRGGCQREHGHNQEEHGCAQPKLWAAPAHKHIQHVRDQAKHLHGVQEPQLDVRVVEQVRAREPVGGLQHTDQDQGQGVAARKRGVQVAQPSCGRLRHNAAQIQIKRGVDQQHHAHKGLKRPRHQGEQQANQPCHVQHDP